MLWDPYKFAETLYRLVYGKKIPVSLPIGEDVLERLQLRLEKTVEVLEDAAPWSADFEKRYKQQGHCRPNCDGMSGGP